MVGLERLLARWFAFRTEVVLCTLTKLSSFPLTLRFYQ